MSSHSCVDKVVTNETLLDLATDLANRLLAAFTKSPSGVPYGFANLRTGAVSQPETGLAETGTYITKFGALSKLTGEPRYYDAAKRAFQVTFQKRSTLDLLPFAVHAETGQFINRTATPASAPTRRRPSAGACGSSRSTRSPGHSSAAPGVRRRCVQPVARNP